MVEKKEFHLTQPFFLYILQVDRQERDIAKATASCNKIHSNIRQLNSSEADAVVFDNRLLRKLSARHESSSSSHAEVVMDFLQASKANIRRKNSTLHASASLHYH